MFYLLTSHCDVWLLPQPNGPRTNWLTDEDVFEDYVGQTVCFTNQKIVQQIDSERWWKSKQIQQTLYTCKFLTAFSFPASRCSKVNAPRIQYETTRATSMTWEKTHVKNFQDMHKAAVHLLLSFGGDTSYAPGWPLRWDILGRWFLLTLFEILRCHCNNLYPWIYVYINGQKLY